MSKITDRSIRTSNWGLPGTRPTSTRAFTGASSAERILNARIISAADRVRVELGPRTSEGGHPIRWPSREEISTLAQRGPRRPILEGPTSRPQQEPRVPGLLVVPQATSDGELHRFVTKYMVHMADAGGTRLTWMRIGDPQDQDRIFRDQLSTATEHDLKAWSAEYEAGVQDARSEEHYIDRENLDILKALGLPQRTLPAIFFLAPPPVAAWAVLSLDVAMFIDPVTERALANRLVEDLAQDKLAPYARGGGFTSTRMKSLQQYLDGVEKEIRKSTGVKLLARAEDGSRQETEPAAFPMPRTASGTYAIAYSSDGLTYEFSKVEYELKREHLEEFDYIVDAITRKCYKRASREKSHQESECTLAEIGMLREMIVRPGAHRPFNLRSGDGSGAAAANHLANSAIFKVENIKGAKRVRLFHRHKGPVERDHRYEFDPPSGATWLLIEMVT